MHNPEVNKNNYTIPEWIFTAKPGLFGLVAGWANPTGVILFVILCIMCVCSLAFVRRGGCFEVNHYNISTMQQVNTLFNL